MNKQLATQVLALAILGGFVWAEDADELRLNQIQVITTHNSYRVAPPRSALSDRYHWNYTHEPLDVQLKNGVRGFELDVYYQPDGFFKVFHVPVHDTGTTCDRFVDCLGVIREWSKANPDHLPIITHIEVKDEPYETINVEILPVNRPELDTLESEVRSVFDREHLFTPDDLRGDYETINDAVRDGAWPILSEVRGKCVFILHNRGRHREAFLKGDPNLMGRAMFNFAVPGAPDAAFIIRDRPSANDMEQRLREGYIIRTRADVPSGGKRKDTALDSGAQLISTDYPPGEADVESGYVVDFGDGIVARPNPITAPDSKVSVKP